MKARVKGCDHINLDAIGLGTAVTICEALKLYAEYHHGNEVKNGLGYTAQVELEAAIEEAEAIRDGVSKELRKQRRQELKSERKILKTDISDILGKDEDAIDEMEAKAEANYQESHIENQAGYMGSDQQAADLVEASSDRCG